MRILRVLGICDRCKRELKINSHKLCKNCYGYMNRDVEKSKERVRVWGMTHRKYFRDYQRKKLNINPENYRKE